MQKKGYPISTKIYRLDLGWVYKNYLNKDMWGKSWCLFDYSGMRVSFRLVSIDIDERLINCRVSVSYKGDKRRRLKPFNLEWYRWNGGTISVPMGNPEYTEAVFERKLNGAVLGQIEMVEKDAICQRSEYKSLEQYLDDYNQKLEDIANEFLDEEGVKNEDIRDAYVSWYQDKMANTSGYELGKVTEGYRYTIMTKYYCLYASMVGDEKDYETYRKYYEKQTPKSHRIDYWKLSQKLKDEDYIEDLREELEPISLKGNIK